MWWLLGEFYTPVVPKGPGGEGVENGGFCVTVGYVSLVRKRDSESLKGLGGGTDGLVSKWKNWGRIVPVWGHLKIRSPRQDTVCVCAPDTGMVGW